MEAFLILAISLIALAAFDFFAVEFGTDSRTDSFDERVRLIDRASIV